MKSSGMDPANILADRDEDLRTKGDGDAGEVADVEAERCKEDPAEARFTTGTGILDSELRLMFFLDLRLALVRNMGSKPGKESESERERDRETDRQRETETERETDRQRQRQRQRQTDRDRDRQTDRDK